MGGWRRTRAVALALALAVAAIPLAPSRAALAAFTLGGERSTFPAPTSRTETQTFWSAALRREMPYLVYLPAGYGASGRRYPVLYMLHGMSGSDTEWRTYGLLDAADRMMADGEIAPFIIIMPQGDRAYWMDHAGPDHEAWGTYTARDLVAEVDSRYRTIRDRSARAIGGDSMGAHGALQLALNHVDVFSIVGSHSLVLRSFEQAFPFFGDKAQYAARDPMTIVRTRPDLAVSLRLWIDIGSQDPWAPRAALFNTELDRLGIPHAWHEWAGGHSRAYWGAHVCDYLRFYGDSFASADAPLYFPSGALLP
ncbi:MAG: hypothetical protein KGN00_02005 [Chloroflexota bacterium]|nr:hypothetical protein [Chloroflexota bacterium]MDE3192439.1 hypothetical protein [Chloroflexota bacterium]